MDRALLSARELVRTGADAEPLFEPISVECHAGESIAVRGPSGSGKTLILRTLTLLDSPDGGEVHWRGDAIAATEIPAHRRRVHLLAQAAPLVDGTALANLALPFTLAIASAAFDRDRAIALLGRFAAADLADRHAGDLSGGERQIVALCRAMLVEPTVLLLDEPTTALDPERTATAESLIAEWLAADSERATLWVSHDAAQLARVTERSVTVVRSERR